MAKPDLRKLLKGGLTGKEAARLIIADSVEVDHGRPGILSKQEIQAIREGLQGREATEYNRWIRAYQLVDYTLKEAHIAALEASNLLWLELETLKMFRLEDQIRKLMGWEIPAIVTQKQYEELRERQKEYKLSGYRGLPETLCDLLTNVEPGLELEQVEPLLWREGSSGEYWDEVLEEVQAEHPEAWRQAVQQIIQAVQAGHLRPVQMDRAAQRQLLALEAEAQQHREELEANMERMEKLGLWEPLDIDSSFWERWQAKRDKIIQQAYEAGLAKYDQARTLQALEALRDGRLPKPARDSFLDASCCSVRELYEAGLEEVDQYIPGLNDATAPRPKGLMQPINVAIIVDPSPTDLHERGWYKDMAAEVLAGISGYAARKARAEEEGIPLGLGLAARRKTITEKIKLYLAIQGIVESISQALGVELGEDFQEWQRQLEAVVDLYNLYAAPVETESGRTLEPPYYLGVPKTVPIKLGKLKPTAKSVQYYRDRMAMALGDSWWDSLTQDLEYEPAEEQSLAAELLEGLVRFRQEATGKPKEGPGGQE